MKICENLWFQRFYWRFTLVKKLDLILYYGLFVLAFVLPISIAATNIVWLFLFLIWIIKIVHTKKIDCVSQLTLPVLLFFCVTLVSAVFGIDFVRSMKKMNSEMLFLIFFLVFANIKNFKHAEKIIVIFIISTAIMGLLGVIQYTLGKDSSFDAHIFSLLQGRAHGSRSWAQTYAEGLLIALPISIYTLLLRRRKIFYLAVILIFSGIIFSYVRMVWLSAVIVLGLMFILEFRRLKKLFYILTAILVLAVISAVLFTPENRRLVPGRRNIIKRAMNFNDPIRINMWKASFEMFKDYPVFGVGKKNVKKFYPAYYEKLELPKKYYKLSHLHSNFIHILVERGCIGLLAYLFLFLSYFYYSIRKLKRASYSYGERFFISGCIFAILGFFLSGITEYSYGDSEIQMIMWFIMALTFYRSPAVFLDRDGTINEDMCYSVDVKRLKIFEGAAPAIKLLNDAGFKVIIVTNQSGIARGYYTKSESEGLSEIIRKKIEETGAVINGIYLCQHHPDAHCSCRKPNPGMILKAKKDFNIDVRKSYVVGDMQSDIGLAKNAGAKSVFVLTGAGKDVKGADYTAEDIFDAAKWIVKENHAD